MIENQAYSPVWRGLRIVFAVTVAVFAATMLGSLFWSGADGHPAYRAGRVLFLLFFVGAVLAPIMAFSVVFFCLDALARSNPGLRRLGHPFVGLTLAAGIALGQVEGLIGTLFLFLFFYWVLAGRVIGRAGYSFRAPWRGGVMKLGYIAFALWLLVPWGVSLGSLVMASVRTVDPGAPAYAVQHEHQQSVFVRRALIRFPDAQSCLRAGADATVRGDLIEMDWDRIRAAADAEVCIFRLLHGWGGVSEAQSWLEAQGLGVSPGFSSARPYQSSQGLLKVHGGWSIRENGPLFPTRGPIRRAFAASAYGMNVVTTFSADGATLLYVQVDFSTL
ncbi:hypothetical protein [Gymnodinialimonas ulvae]|uniref:hypothetical protein n=1 Tax=Gymnodinialimonas ulvae TaxID=3126504 RepID=UPI0030991D65